MDNIEVTPYPDDRSHYLVDPEDYMTGAIYLCNTCDCWTKGYIEYNTTLIKCHQCSSTNIYHIGWVSLDGTDTVPTIDPKNPNITIDLRKE